MPQIINDGWKWGGGGEWGKKGWRDIEYGDVRIGVDLDVEAWVNVYRSMSQLIND